MNQKYQSKILPKVLVITSSIDGTVDYIINKFKMVSFYRFNVDHLFKYQISIGGSNEWQIKSECWDTVITPLNIQSIYYRKPMFPDLEEYEQDYWQLITRDIHTVVTGLVNSFGKRVLSRPHLLARAENKVFQLSYTIRNSIPIPISNIGNDNYDLSRFILNKSIIKPLSVGKAITESGCELYQTTMLQDFEGDISMTPIYLQEYVEKAYEVRITIINRHIYSVRIDCDDKIDWRKDYSSHEYALIKIPESVEHMCLTMLDDFGLVFGAFDFIVNTQGQWIFLEVNPNGQWLWLEKALNLDISNNIGLFVGEKE